MQFKKIKLTLPKLLNEKDAKINTYMRFLGLPIYDFDVLVRTPNTKERKLVSTLIKLKIDVIPGYQVSDWIDILKNQHEIKPWFNKRKVDVCTYGLEGFISNLNAFPNELLIKCYQIKKLLKTVHFEIVTVKVNGVKIENNRLLKVMNGRCGYYIGVWSG